MSSILHPEPGYFSYLLLPTILKPGLLRLAVLGFIPQFVLFPAASVNYSEITQCASFWACPCLLASCPCSWTFPKILLFSWASPAVSFTIQALMPSPLLTDAPAGPLAGMNCYVGTMWTPEVLNSIPRLAVAMW